jgi:SAM-dependent methyltransferase
MAQSLPFPDDVFASAVAAMSLQILLPLDKAVSEFARVVRPGGTVVILLPARRPLPWRDVILYLALQLRLRRSIGYPNEGVLDGEGLARLVSRYGLEVVDDRRAPFVLPLSTVDEAEEFVQSLYLPDVPSARVIRAVGLIRRRVGRRVTIPLRRVVLRRSGRDP